MTDWEKNGIRIVHPSEFDRNTPQTQGMTRAAAITQATAFAQKLWAGRLCWNPERRAVRITASWKRFFEENAQNGLAAGGFWGEFLGLVWRPRQRPLRY